MGYGVFLVAILILVPLLIVLLTRRRGPAPGGLRRSGSPLDRNAPSADEPTPGEGASRQPEPGAGRRIPPA